MVQRMYIDVADYATLCDCIRMAIDVCKDTHSFPGLIQYLEMNLAKVERKVKNERFGDDIATEIDNVMEFIDRSTKK